MSKIIKAKSSHWQASLYGACAIALGLGVVLAGYISKQAGWALIILGVIVHGWGMYNMYRR